MTDAIEQQEPQQEERLDRFSKRIEPVMMVWP
jgi:hypothetical protein